jgi:hypothetical protein
MTLTDFIARCDAYCRKAGVSRVWLSKALLANTYHLDRLARGEGDIGVRRMNKVLEALAALESDAAKQAA